MKAAHTRRGLTDVAYEYVKGQLFESRFLPGDWLPIDPIATELGVSRQPVMDCMKRLAMDGFVLIVPQVGCQVRSYSAEEIADFFRLFAFGEALATEMATSRATDDDLRQLQAVSRRIGELATQNLSPTDLARKYRELNRVFHAEIRRMARSPSVTEVVEHMGDRGDFFVATSGRPFFAETLREAHTEHEEVLHAMMQRDSAKAAGSIRHHIEATNRRLQAFLTQAVERRGQTGIR
jgi:DNA-binding GntR family transcriptional regulator